MNPLSKAVQWLSEKAVEASFNTVTVADWYLRNGYYRIAGLLGAGGGYSPRPINAQTAMQVGAVFACVKTIAEDCSSLPLFVYQRVLDTRRIGKQQPASRFRADDHPLSQLLHVMPNPETSAAEFREALTAHVLLTGNGYAKIARAGGRIVALWQLMPDQVEPARDPRNNMLFYRVRDPQGQWIDTPASDVFHLRGFGWDGISGYSIIQHAKQTIGLALSAEEYAARFFGQDQTPPFALSHPAKLGPEGVKGVKKAWRDAQQGAENWHTPAVLQEGMTIQRFGISNSEVQFLEQRKFSIPEIARLFRVPAHKIGDLERATFSNIEQQAIEYVTQCLRIYLNRWEQAIQRSLFTVDERSSFYVEHSIEGLLRGDFTAQTNGFARLLAAGVYSINEVRSLMNLNPIDGGDNHFIQLNQATVQDVASGASVQAQDGQIPVGGKQ